MKLAFTTLGCPKWDLDTILQYAVANGFDGVDFRGYLGEMDVFKSNEFSTNLTHTKEKFAKAKIEIPCFSSSVRLFTSSDNELNAYIEELKKYVHLCSVFQTPYIRVFGGPIGQIQRKDALTIVVKNLKKMLPIVEEHKVCLLLETHDDWTDCESIQALLDKVDSPFIQVLWDVHHPFRTVGENPHKTWERLGERIKYTHWKDSYLNEDTVRGYQLCLLGEGDIPLMNIYQLLREKKYDGYFTLEWEKVWCPEIEEPEIAFHHFVQYIRSMHTKQE